MKSPSILSAGLLFATIASGAVLLTGCGTQTQHEDLGVMGDVDLAVATDVDLARADGATDGAVAHEDGGALAQCAAPASLSRGNAWVRSHRMMVSGLSVAMGSPNAAVVNEYFDGFHGNAVHLWANGLPTEIAGWNAAGRSDFRYVSWVEADGTSAAPDNAGGTMLLGGAAPLPGRIGYQIGDEPGDAAALAPMLVTAAAIRAADPDALTIINVNDGDGVDGFRDQAITNASVDVLSYDHYVYRVSGYGALNKVRKAALAAGKPYWRYAQAFYYADESAESTEADLRWDAFLGPPFGYTVHTWFLYQIDAGNQDLMPLLFGAKGDYAATKTSLYAVAAALNTQLAQLGRTISLLRSVDVRYVTTVLNLSGLDAWQKGAGGDPYLAKITAQGTARDAAVGLFRDDCDEPYVILQNVAHPGAFVPNTSASPTTFRVELDFSASTDATLDRGALVGLDLATGLSTTIVLNGAGDLRTVDLNIPAGGIVLWKYKNARPIVRQP